MIPLAWEKATSGGMLRRDNLSHFVTPAFDISLKVMFNCFHFGFLWQHTFTRACSEGLFTLLSQMSVLCKS